MGVIGAIFATSAFIAGLVLFGAPWLERSLMYSPDPTRVMPADAGLAGVEELTLSIPDGARIVAWYSPAADRQPTLLYVHGNAGTLADRVERIASYQRRGVGVFIMSYRGYSGSTGRPSETNNVADAVFAYDSLRARGVGSRDIIVYGESIGTGIAVQVATARDVGGVILDAPYTSIVDIAEIFYPYLPARLLMRDRYETLDKHLPKLTAPVLVIHGEADEVIPVEMGRRVAAAAPAGGEIATFPEAGHSDHYLHGSFDAVMDWIERVWRPRRALDEKAGGGERSHDTTRKAAG